MSKKENIVTGLNKLLADTYTLYLKTHNFHWNVTGPHFSPLHLMFEGQYTELALAVDAIAERIRTLGFPAPGSYAAFSKLATIREETGVPAANDMVAALAADQEIIVRSIQTLWPTVDDAGDQGTLDLLTQRLSIHEKTAWMLKSSLA